MTTATRLPPSNLPGLTWHLNGRRPRIEPGSGRGVQNAVAAYHLNGKTPRVEPAGGCGVRDAVVARRQQHGQPLARGWPCWWRWMTGAKKRDAPESLTERPVGTRHCKTGQKHRGRA